MKIIPESKYKYAGRNGAWHIFISRDVKIDREIICVPRAKYLLEKGGTKIFSRIVEKKRMFDERYKLEVSGICAMTIGGTTLDTDLNMIGSAE